MRVNSRWRRRCVLWLNRWAYSLIAVLSAMPYATAGELIPTVSGVSLPATALSLTLVTAVMKLRK